METVEFCAGMDKNLNIQFSAYNMTTDNIVVLSVEGKLHGKNCTSHDTHPEHNGDVLGFFLISVGVLINFNVQSSLSI